MATYTELATDIATWLNRTGMTAVTDEIEHFVAFAQSKVARTIDLNAMLNTTSGMTTADLTVPTGLLRVKSFSVVDSSDTVELQGVPYRKAKNVSSTTGTPKYYAIENGSFILAPTPDQTYSLELTYYKALTPVSPTNATNWLSDTYPEVILYGALLEASLFIKDDQRAMVWKTKFDEALEEMKKSDDTMGYEEGGLQVRSSGSVLNDSARSF